MCTVKLTIITSLTLLFMLNLSFALTKMAEKAAESLASYKNIFTQLKPQEAFFDSI